MNTDIDDLIDLLRSDKELTFQEMSIAADTLDFLRRERDSWKVMATLSNQRADRFWNELLALRANVAA